MRAWIAAAVLVLSACAPKEPPVSNWFSETFALGSPLRDPVGALGTAWAYFDGGASSQYAKLVNARNPGAEVHDTYGRSGSPALYSSDATAGRTMYSTWALVGNAWSRSLSPAADAGVVVLDFYVQFVGSNPSALNVYLYSSPSIYAPDLNLQFYNSTTFKVALTYAIPNGGGVFGVSDDYSIYSIGALNCWRGDGLWHHIRVEARAGTITTWTPGTFNDENDYTGGDLVVASDGWLKLYIDDAEVISIAGAPFIMNFDGQDANESSPGSWVTSERLVEANVNRLSLFEVGIVGGGSYLDDITVSGLANATWVNVADYLTVPIPSSAFPSAAARILGYLWSSDPAAVLQARLYNVDDAASAGESAELSGATPQACDFGVQLASGTKTYALQVTSDIPGTDIFFSSRGVGV